jgi:hypothetical protein
MANDYQDDEKPQATSSENALAPENNQFRTNDEPDEKYFNDVRAKLQDWPIYNSDDAIRAVLQQNVIRTRVLLFKDCLTYRQMDFSADQGQMQHHVEQYSQPDHQKSINMWRLIASSASCENLQTLQRNQ